MRRNGFTLIELLVVLAIIAAATAAAVPPLAGGNGAAVMADARLLAAGLRSARGEALVGNAEVVFVLDLPHRRFGQPGRWTPWRDATAVTVTAAGEEQPDARTAAIRFYPDGSATGGEVRLAAAGRRVTVAVDWLTGLVDLREGPDD